MIEEPFLQYKAKGTAKSLMKEYEIDMIDQQSKRMRFSLKDMIRHK